MQRQPVRLAGTSSQIAARWAEVNGRQVKKHVAGFLADIAGGSGTPRGLLDGSVYARGEGIIQNKKTKSLFEFFDIQTGFPLHRLFKKAMTLTV